MNQKELPYKIGGEKYAVFRIKKSQSRETYSIRENFKIVKMYAFTRKVITVQKSANSF